MTGASHSFPWEERCRRLKTPIPWLRATVADTRHLKAQLLADDPDLHRAVGSPYDLQDLAVVSGQRGLIARPAAVRPSRHPGRRRGDGPAASATARSCSAITNSSRSAWTSASCLANSSASVSSSFRRA
ncbi:hypothetical protein ACH4UV_37365 [Streptomyces sp. NPDC020802]|uniref:hypothetical protein n=1 Tax=Streptomyces sp. NPDC020802 TaxID=3365094 RepID=UPI0037B0EB68